MVLSFKSQFKKPIISGSKIHTIREDKTNRWKAGNEIHFATGVRTKNYNQFHSGKCISIQTIEIKYPTECFNDAIIEIEGIKLSTEEMQKLAYNDGFKNLLDLLFWFREDFKGKIIHWTDYKY